MYLFSYGSNNPEQLKERLKKQSDIMYIPACIKDYTRIFGGYSKKWDGAVASIYPCKGRHVYGILTRVTHVDIDILDKYEQGYYRKIIEVVEIQSNKKRRAIIYIKNDITYICPPSKEYIAAIQKTLQCIPNRIHKYHIHVQRVDGDKVVRII